MNYVNYGCNVTCRNSHSIRAVIWLRVRQVRRQVLAMNFQMSGRIRSSSTLTIAFPSKQCPVKRTLIRCQELLPSFETFHSIKHVKTQECEYVYEDSVSSSFPPIGHVILSHIFTPSARRLLPTTWKCLWNSLKKKVINHFLLFS